MHPSKWSFLYHHWKGAEGNLLIVFPPARTERRCMLWTSQILKEDRAGKMLGLGREGHTVWWTGFLLPPLTWWVSHVLWICQSTSINLHWKPVLFFVKWNSTLHQHWKFEGETSHSVLLFCFWKSGFLAPMTLSRYVFNSQILRKFAWKFGFQISVIHSKFVVVEDLLLGPSTARLPVYRTVPQWLSVAVWASENGARLPGA